MINLPVIVLYLVKFYVCDLSIPWTLEIFSDGGFKQEHAESSTLPPIKTNLYYHNASGLQTW